MKFIFPCDDHDFENGKKSGCINGGTSYFWHLAHTLQDMGHEAELVRNCSDFPLDCDVIMIQSEWYGGQLNKFKEAREKGIRVVVLLGHFVGGVGRPYYDPNLIEADLFVSTWKGAVVDNFKQEVKFFPHGYCKVCDNYPEKNHKGDIIWVGNNYPLRDEDWLSGLSLTRVNGVMPNELGAIYRAAEVNPNRHGSFQSGQVSAIPSTLADVPGFACNERLFQITGSGGFQVADDNPQIKDFFNEDELVCGNSKEDFQNKILRYQNDSVGREKFIQKGRERVLAEHTYHHRCEKLLEWLN